MIFPCILNQFRVLSSNIIIILNLFFKNKESNPQAKPPFRSKKYYKVIYKKSAISYNDNILSLSNGRKGKSIKIKIVDLKKTPKYAELLYNTYQEKYEVHIVVEVKNKQKSYEDNDKTLAIDLGQIHPMTTFDGKKVKIYNGGKLNSFIRFRNKKLARLNRKMSRCQRYSRRWQKLNQAKKKLLNKSYNKIMDVLKKYTSSLIDYCLRHKISLIVAGDLTGIRDSEDVKFNSKTKQKIHQWTFKKIMNMIEYKAMSVGIKLKTIDESYTSQTCPVCGNKNKTNTRNYKCSDCGFKYHRDGVGAINIYKKYTAGTLEGDKSDWLEGVLTSPYGLRYQSETICCRTGWSISAFDSAG